MSHDHITSLGYRVEFSDDPAVVKPLLDAVDLEGHFDDLDHEFMLACTTAGGIAACVGWTRVDRFAVLHSLVVAPPSRGSGVGLGLMASAMAHVMDQNPLDAFYLTTPSSGARRLFGSLGFFPTDHADIPEVISEHPEFRSAIERSVPMARSYGAIKRGLDNCAFRLVTNDTPDATLPLGSVFLFRQNGSVIESSYRGGPVVRGHLLGIIEEEQLRFCWHQFIRDGDLMRGDGSIVVKPMEDGRRELVEHFSNETSDDPIELLLREV